MKNLFFLPIVICLFAFEKFRNDTKERMFNGAFGGGYKSDRVVNLNTGKSSANFDKEILFKADSLFISDHAKKSEIRLYQLQDVDKNAKEGKRIIKGYHYESKSYYSIRLVLLNYWDGKSDGTIISSPLMLGDYQPKNDTIEIYYKPKLGSKSYQPCKNSSYKTSKTATSPFVSTMTKCS